MRIRVEGVRQAPLGQTSVSFVSEIGRARGQWVGTAPEVDVEYEVEIDIPGGLTWGDQISATAQGAPALLEEEGDTLVLGTLVSFDGEVAQVRLRDDLIMIEVDRVDGELPRHVMIKTRDLRLFDVNI